MRSENAGRTWVWAYISLSGILYEKKVLMLVWAIIAELFGCFQIIIYFQRVNIKNNALLTGLLLYSKHSLGCKRSIVLTH